MVNVRQKANSHFEGKILKTLFSLHAEEQDLFHLAALSFTSALISYPSLVNFSFSYFRELYN